MNDEVDKIQTIKNMRELFDDEHIWNSIEGIKNVEDRVAWRKAFFESKQYKE